MMEESISHNAGKVLLQIYISYINENKILNFNKLKELTNFEENKLMRALEYCYDKELLDIEIINLMGSKAYTIRRITAKGIDIITKSTNNSNLNKPFNITFNFNNEFNIDSIIKGEVKLF